MFLSSGIDTVMMSMYTNVSVGYNPLLVVSPIFFFFFGIFLWSWCQPNSGPFLGYMFHYP